MGGVRLGATVLVAGLVADVGLMPFAGFGILPDNIYDLPVNNVRRGVRLYSAHEPLARHRRRCRRGLGG
jgi:hypothetical protein